MKKLFFVMGPEGSGTHIMTQALYTSGAQEVLQGVRSYDSNYAHLTSGFPDLVSMQRSLPANGRWANLAYAKSSFTRDGYEVFPLFMTRDFNATIQSQIRRGTVANVKEAQKNICRAFFEVASVFWDEFIPVSYESFCANTGFRRWLFAEKLELPEPTITIVDGNRKYYE